MRKILKQIIFLLTRRNIFSVNYTCETKLYNKKWVIPVINNIGKSHLELHEKYLFDVYEKLLKNAKEFIDIGANIGQTLIKVKSINPAIGYTAFEPSISCIHYIENLARLNSIKNFGLYPIGIASQTAVVKFYVTAQHSQGNSIIEGIRIQKEHLSQKFVPVFSFEDLQFPSSFSTDNVLIKIDVEGAEYLVLEGMTKFISKVKPVLLIEFLRISEKDEVFMDEVVREKRLKNQLTCEEIFKQVSYDKYLITENGEFILTNVIGYNMNEKNTNYLVVPVGFNIGSLMN
ncbi:hypothetical protein BH11BAC3_BH11BAC3_19350 [soil metagenome]